MNETSVVSYTHCDVQYVTVHNYHAKDHYHYEEHDGRRYAGLVYIEAGSACFSQGENIIEAPKGGWVYLPEGCRYQSSWHGEDISYFLLNFKMVRRLIIQHIPHVSVIELGSSQPTERICLVTCDDPVLKNELDQIFRYFAAPQQNILATASFYRLWYHVACIFDRHTSDDEIANAVTYIENHLLNPLCLDELYRLCCMGKSTFFKRFRAATGTTPVQYRNHLLAAMGRELLDSGSYTIAQVSEMLRLCSPDYLTVLMKKAGKCKNSVS